MISSSCTKEKLIKVAIETGSMERGLGQDKICVKRQYELPWLN